MKAAVGLVAVCAGGCAQILGLEPTEKRDGGGLCTVDLECAGSADRSICGRMVDPTTNQPFTAIGATGAACQPGATEGPCAFLISGESTGELFSGVGNPVAASIQDDCGRFKIEGVTGTDLAVLAQPQAPADIVYKQVARTILYTDSGPVDDIRVPVVSEALITGWEANAPAGTDVPDGFLLLFRRGATPVQTVSIRVDMNQIPDPPSTPFGLYFAGPRPFQTIVDVDPTGDAGMLRTESGPSGTAVLVPDSTAPFVLGGTRVGAQCDSAAVGSVNRVIDTFVYVELTNC